jgi:hypothetical protein
MTRNNYTFTNINNSNSRFNSAFAPSFNHTDDSKALDSLILSSLIEKNPYMKDIKFGDIDIDYAPEKKKSFISYIFGKNKSATKATNKTIDLLSAIDYLAHNYKGDSDNNLSNNYIKIKLADGTRLYIFDDEIQIDDTLYSLSDSAAILNGLSPAKKKLIIDFVIDIKL